LRIDPQDNIWTIDVAASQGEVQSDGSIGLVSAASLVIGPPAVGRRR
jgi:hypothetical protein